MSDKITASHVLFPVGILSLVITLLLGYQTTLLFADRDALHHQYADQDKPLQQIEKIKAQVNALAIGTLRLSQQGNKDASTLIAELKKSGVDVTDQANAAPQQPGGGGMTAMPQQQMVAPASTGP
jgi:hypothetical protein